MSPASDPSIRSHQNALRCPLDVSSGERLWGFCFLDRVFGTGTIHDHEQRLLTPLPMLAIGYRARYNPRSRATVAHTLAGQAGGTEGRSSLKEQLVIRKMDDIPEIPKEVLEAKFPGGFSIRDEANAIVALAVRNGPLEDLHAGVSTELLDDPGNSRITDDEMKELMIFACERVEMLLKLKETDPEKYWKIVMTYGMLYCGNWYRGAADSGD